MNGLVSLVEGRDVGPCWIANDLALGVDDAERVERHGDAVGNELHVFQFVRGVDGHPEAALLHPRGVGAVAVFVVYSLRASERRLKGVVECPKPLCWL